MCMKNKIRRVDFLIGREEVEYLSNLPGTVSEHIRFAIAQYIHRLRQEEVRLARSARASASGGEKDG